MWMPCLQASRYWPSSGGSATSSARWMRRGSVAFRIMRSSVLGTGTVLFFRVLCRFMTSNLGFPAGRHPAVLHNEHLSTQLHHSRVRVGVRVCLLNIISPHECSKSC